MIETELLTFPLEGKDKFIAEMKTFNDPHYRREFMSDLYMRMLGKTKNYYYILDIYRKVALLEYHGVRLNGFSFYQTPNR